MPALSNAPPVTPTPFFRPSTTRRLARWVLMLWLMAIGCAGSAPLLQPTQAVQPKLDCVAHKAQQSKALPKDGGGLWHCSQCLMAGPPPAWPAAASLVQRAARAAVDKLASSPLLSPLSLRPPARAPPLS